MTGAICNGIFGINGGEHMEDTNNRVRAIIRNGSKILCFHANSKNRYYSAEQYFLPGGHIRSGEGSKAAIIRELQEEVFGVEVRSVSILGVFELKWSNEKSIHEEIDFVYDCLVEFTTDPALVTSSVEYLDGVWLEESDIIVGKFQLLPREIATHLKDWEGVSSDIREKIAFSSGFELS